MTRAACAIILAVVGGCVFDWTRTSPDGGASTGTGGRSPFGSCPGDPPLKGTLCQQLPPPVQQNGGCYYGDDPRARCRMHAKCTYDSTTNTYTWHLNGNNAFPCVDNSPTCPVDPQTSELMCQGMPYICEYPNLPQKPE